MTTCYKWAVCIVVLFQTLTLQRSILINKSLGVRCYVLQRSIKPRIIVCDHFIDLTIHAFFLVKFPEFCTWTYPFRFQSSCISTHLDFPFINQSIIHSIIQSFSQPTSPWNNLSVDIPGQCLPWTLIFSFQPTPNPVIADITKIRFFCNPYVC